MEKTPKKTKMVGSSKGPQNVLRKLPPLSTTRKTLPIMTGVVDFFPLALAEIARISLAGNAQHTPGEPLHWARNKSQDHGDCAMRHWIERGSIDNDGHRHTAKAAWRALALLQEELEQAAGWTPKENKYLSAEELKEIDECNKARHRAEILEIMEGKDPWQTESP